MLSEALTIIGNIAYYRKCYKGIPGLLRMIFWAAAGILTVGGLFIAFS
jgi:hypothetical protein